MIKNLLIIGAVFLLASSSGFAKTVKLKTISGTIHNFSDLKPEQVKISVRIYNTNAWGEELGGASKTAQVKPDGSFTIPSFSYSHLDNRFFHFSYLLSYQNNQAKEVIFPNFEDDKRYFSEDESKLLYSALSKITLFQINAHTASVQFNGISFEDFIQSEYDYAKSFTIYYNLSDPSKPKSAKYQNEVYFSLETGPTRQLAKKYFMFPGSGSELDLVTTISYGPSPRKPRVLYQGKFNLESASYPLESLSSVEDYQP